MNILDIKAIQTRVGATPDGIWGPQSKQRALAYLAQLGPAKNPWPAQDEASLLAFYGPAGDESRLVSIDVSGFGLKYDGAPVTKVRCHARVSDSLRRILRELSTVAPEILARYAGVYNNRAMRGGSKPSLHARGTAIDLDPDPNGNLTTWPGNATMPWVVIEAFSREGWLSAAVAWGRDAMHFQATR